MMTIEELEVEFAEDSTSVAIKKIANPVVLSAAAEAAESR
jgi:hypothetical protein